MADPAGATLLDLACLTGGLLGLLGGGDVIVRGALKIARVFQLPAVVVGVTVMAFGTSLPELAASMGAAIQGAPGLVLGTVAGSNLANLGLILGACALAAPVFAGPGFMSRGAPSLLVTALMFAGVAWDGAVSRGEGLLLTAGIPVFIVVMFSQQKDESTLDTSPEPRALLKGVGLAVVGSALLLLGADWFVQGATGLARSFGVEERIIGLTLVALGTSLPELSSSLMAARRGEGGLVVGNVVGSNVLNVLAVLGLTAVVHPIAVPAPPHGDLITVAVASVAVLALLSGGRSIGRVTGGAMLLIYGGATLYWFL